MDLSFKPKVWFAIMAISGLLILWLFQRPIFRSTFFESEDAEVRRQLAENWAQKAARKSAGDGKVLVDRPTVIVAPVVNDSDGILFVELKEWIGRRNTRLKNGRWFHNASYTLGFSNQPKNVDEAVSRCLSDSADFIVAAEVHEWTTYPDFERNLTGTLYIHNAETGALIQSFNIAAYEHIVLKGETDVAKNDSEMSTYQTNQSSYVFDTNDLVANTHSTMRPQIESGTRTSLLLGLLPSIFVWVFAILVTPLLFRRRINRLLNEHSNSKNAQLLCVWVTFAVITAILIWGLWLPIYAGAAATIAAAVFASCYLGIFCRNISNQ